jgi:hypothetical protein
MENRPQKIDLISLDFISLADVRPFHLFWFASHTQTKTYLEIHSNQSMKLLECSSGVTADLFYTPAERGAAWGDLFLMASLLKKASCEIYGPFYDKLYKIPLQTRHLQFAYNWFQLWAFQFWATIFFHSKGLVPESEERKLGLPLFQFMPNN